MFTLVSPSLYCPDYCEGQPALHFAPVVLGSVVEPPAAADSSDQEKRHPVNIQDCLYQTTKRFVWYKQIISGWVISRTVCSGYWLTMFLTMFLFSCRKFSSSFSSCCLALSKSSWPCFVLDSTFTVSAFCTDTQTTNHKISG